MISVPETRNIAMKWEACRSEKLPGYREIDGETRGEVELRAGCCKASQILTR